MKTIMNASVVSLALTLALAGPAPAQTARKGAQTALCVGGPLAMNVAGVRLGMPLAGAEAALEGVYRCDHSMRERSFRQLVDSEVKKRQEISEGFGPDGAAVAELNCNGPSGEYLRLFMAQTMAGEVVDRIDLTVRTDRVDQAALVRQVEGKYGRPTTGTAADGSWCSRRCGYDLTMETGPRIATMSGGKYFKILGSRGLLARQADDAAVRAAADRIAPAATRGAF